MGAICEACGQDMMEAEGCRATHILNTVSGKFVRRSLEHWSDDRCHDCNAKVRTPHHFGCDVERCPVCGNQLISCECCMDEVGRVLFGTPV